jgi:hypothetical protein
LSAPGARRDADVQTKAYSRLRTGRSQLQARY